MARETIAREGSNGGRGTARAGLLLIGAAVLGMATANVAQAQDSTASAAPAAPAAPAVKVDPKVTIEANKRAQGPDIMVKGKGFTPGGNVRVQGTNPPGSGKRLDFGVIKADSTGAFTLRKSEACTTSDQNELSREVSFTVTDETSKKVAKGRVEGGPWGC
jgi:hypothetical protein